MDINEILKQFKNIEPRSGYTSYSRADLIERFEKKYSTQSVIVQAAVRLFQGGSAIALSGVLLLVVLGGFSAWSILRPFGVPALDPAGLRVEAQAIDIQIQLTDLEYPAFINAQESGDPESDGIDSKETVLTAPEEISTSASLEAPASSTPTVDDVLMLLIEE